MRRIASRRGDVHVRMDTLINIVPRNPIRAAAETDMLGVIFFGLMFGAR